jgi:alcohol dehydrogenase (cytochrome c)
MKRSVLLAALLALTTVALASEAFATADQAEDWITINKDYSSQRYVDLDQITPANVDELKEVCEIQLNEPVWFSSGLLKVGRTLYVTTLRGTYAFDAATCELRWRHVIDFKQTIAALANRGPGYLEGRIFRGTADGRVIALDAKTGQLLWEVQGANPNIREGFNSAPIAWQGKVFIGIAVSDNRIAGRLMAFDAQTGQELWRFDTTMGRKFGGGFWTTYSLDPKTGEVFAGIANPYPDFNRDLQKDDDIYTVYTNSVISIDAVNTPEAQLNWSYQAVPRDEHDWDLATAPTLYRTPGGKDMLAIAGKSGRVYGIDRATQALAFNTPATTIARADEPLDKTWKLVCPGLQGGALWNGTAYHPGTGALYVGMSDHCTYYTKNADIKPGGGIPIKDFSQQPMGWITAIDGETGEVLWKYHAESQVQAGLVPTKSGLLFAGDTHGNLLALDATSGSVLKQIDVKGALNSGLISYRVDGEQYVAATVGGPTENPSTVAGPLRVSIFGLQGSDWPTVVKLDRLQPEALGVPASTAMFVQVCSTCHGTTGGASSAPPLTRQSQLADPELLKLFLATVLPPMPRLYPGLLKEQEVELIAEHLQTTVFKCGQPEGESCEPPGKPSTGGTAEWRAIYSVLTYPRCINCHPGPTGGPPPIPIPGWPAWAFDYPRQADDRHPHLYGVYRGPETDNEGNPDNKGAPFGRCDTCHGLENNPTTGVPGATNKDGEVAWYLAPTAMAWESSPGNPMTGAELCAQLKDPARNGGLDLKELLHYIETEPLVLWAWDPGTRLNGEARTTPPLSHEDFVDTFEKWIDAGAPCPAQ